MKQVVACHAIVHAKLVLLTTLKPTVQAVRMAIISNSPRVVRSLEHAWKEITQLMRPLRSKSMLAMDGQTHHQIVLC